jgi:hypothetical protein
MCTILRLLKALQCCSAVEESLVYSNSGKILTSLPVSLRHLCASSRWCFSYITATHFHAALFPIDSTSRTLQCFIASSHCITAKSFNLSRTPVFQDIVSETDCAITSNGFFILASRLYLHIYAHPIAASMADGKVTTLTVCFPTVMRCTTIWCWSVSLLWHQSHTP